MSSRQSRQKWLGRIAAAALLVAPPAALAQSPGAIGPSPNSNAGLGTVRTTAAASSLQAMSRAGNVYAVGVTNYGGSAGFLLGYDSASASAPVDGSGKTPNFCYAVAGASTLSANWAPGPGYNVQNGLWLVFSTGADCYTQTSANAFLWANGALR